MLACRVPSGFWKYQYRASSTFIYPDKRENALVAPGRASPKLDTKTQIAIIEKLFPNRTIDITQQGIPERRNLEQVNLLEKFGLSRIPTRNQNNHGVRIDEMGLLEITCPDQSREKHKTALILSRSPRSLVERDFVRILGPGKHIEGWKSQGGLEQSNSLFSFTLIHSPIRI